LQLCFKDTAESQEQTANDGERMAEMDQTTCMYISGTRRQTHSEANLQQWVSKTVKVFLSTEERCVKAS